MLFKDNKISISLIKDVKSQIQIKYIDIIYYYIWKFVEEKEICIK